MRDKFTTYRTMLVAAILSVCAAMNSCIDVEDMYGADLKDGTIDITHTERVDSKTYKADIVVDFQQPEFASQDFAEAGIIVESENGSQRKKIALTTSLSNLHNLSYTFNGLKYDEEYTIRQYFLANLPHTNMLYESEKVRKLNVPHYAHIAIESIKASVSGSTVDVDFTLNDTYSFEDNYPNNRWEVILCLDPADFDQDNSHGRIVLSKSSINRKGKTFHGTFDDLGIDRDYYLRARFQLGLLGHYVYSDIIKVHTEGEAHPTDCAVDLGLSVLWSSHNFGATSPEQRGTAWGFDIGVFNNYYQTYNIDRIAWQWGNGWRRPTREELEELCTSCTPTLETFGNPVTIRLTGPNGNYIILPGVTYNCTSPDGKREVCTINWYSPNGFGWRCYTKDDDRTYSIYLRGVRSK